MSPSSPSSRLAARHRHGDCPTWTPDQFPDPMCRPPDALITASQTREPWDSNIKYAQIITWLLLALIGAAIVPNLVHQLRLHRPQLARSLTQRIPGYAAFVCTYRRLAYAHPHPSLPSLWSLLFLTTFTLSTLIWTFSVRPYYRKDATWGSTPLGLRTGMLSNGMLPFVYALALKRCNPITWLTGLSHERLQFYHQWLARLAWLYGALHSLVFLIDDSRPGNPWRMLAKWWEYSPWCYNTGVAALIAMTWLVFSSIRKIRNAAYQWFWVNHVASNCLFLGFYFAHTDDMMHSWRWLWPIVGLWVGSSVMKWAWSTLLTGTVLRGARARVQAGTGGYLHVAVFVKERDVRRRLFSWKPGQHVFVRFPTLRPWQSHPFTIASIDEARSGDASGEQPLLMLLAREGQGITQLIGEAARTKSGDGSGALDLPVALDGPYGATVNLAAYDGVLFIAGGAGISFMLPLLQDLASKRRSNTDGHGFFCRSVKLVWAVRHGEAGEDTKAQHPLLAWVEEPLAAVKAELAATTSTNQADKPTTLLSPPEVSLDVYLTNWTQSALAGKGQAATTTDLKATTASSSSSPSSSSSSPFAIAPGHDRPNVSTIVHDFVSEEQAQWQQHRTTMDDAPSSAPSPSLLVIVCGPHGMALEVSNAVAALQQKQGDGQGWPDVTLLREDFEW